MVNKPSFRLMSENKDITALLQKNLINLTYTNKQGAEVDDMSFSVYGLYHNKPFGTDISLELGYNGKLYSCGFFTIQSISKNYVQKTTTVRATAVNFASSQKNKRTHTWGSTNLYDIALKIAEDNNMSLKAAEETKKVEIVSVLQNNEEDFSFLNNLCIDRGFIASFFSNHILIEEKNTAASMQIETVQTTKKTHKIKIENLNSLTINEQNRDVYDAVIATWLDTDIGDIKAVKVGKGEVQVDTINIPMPKSDAEGIEIATARLKELISSGVDGSFGCEGFEIRVGELIEIESVEGVFQVENVSHALNNSGYTISVTFKG